MLFFIEISTAFFKGIIQTLQIQICIETQIPSICQSNRCMWFSDN